MKKVLSLFLSFLLVISSLIPSSTAYGETLATATVESQVYDGHSYRVFLPAGYDPASSVKYPSVYLMPKDGLSSQGYIDDGIEAQLSQLMAGDQVLDMIVIMPDFAADDNYTALLSALVADVEAKYNVIKDANYRGILGVNIGGYMAYASALLDSTSASLFKAVGSHAGDFTNNFRATSGSAVSVSAASGSAVSGPAVTTSISIYDAAVAITRTNMIKKYFYIDGPSGDTKTTAAGSTSDIGAELMKKSNPYYGTQWQVYGTPNNAYVEYTIRDGVDNAAFYLSSLARSLNRFSNCFTSGLITGSLTLSPQAVTASNDTVNAIITLTLTNKLQNFIPDIPAVNVKISMIDPNSKVVLYQTTTSFTGMTLGTPKSETIVLNRSDMAAGINTTVAVEASVLGMKFDLASQSLVRVQQTGTADDEQLIDLMGNWYFNAYKNYSASDTTIVDLDRIANIIPSTYSTWDVVQPALGWWTATFASSLGGSGNRACYAWYVRTFDVPADFPTENLLLTVGKFDEANEVYINGVLVGHTGYKYTGEVGVYDGSNPWDVNCVYDFDTSVLKYGETNTIAIRMCNSSGGGGWYEGPVGIYSMAAYNKASGKPSTYATTDNAARVNDLVNLQKAAIEAEDISGYAATLSSEFFHSGYNKERKVNEVQSWMNTYDNLQIVDTNVGVFMDGSTFNYQAQRTITGVDSNGSTQTIFTGAVSEYYIDEGAGVIQYGDHSRFYVDTYVTDAINGTTQTLTARVYLPEGYFDSEERYPTAYLFHGINSSSNSFVIDKVDKVLDSYIAQGTIDKMVVVIPDDPTKTSFWRNGYADMITQDLIPTIDARYRTIQDARYRFTAGCSMGGAGSFGIGLTNPNLFSGAISFYGALTYNNIVTNTTNLSAEYLSRYGLYMTSGNMDNYNFYDVAGKMSQILNAKGVTHYLYIDNGKHDSAFYLPLFDDAFSYMSNRLADVNLDASLLTGSLSLTENEASLSVKYNLAVSDAIVSYLETVPASNFTLNQNPDLVIPMSIIVEQNGKTVAASNHYFNTKTANSWENTITFENADFDITKEYSISQYASVLSDTVLVSNYVVKPVTGITVNGPSSLAMGSSEQIIATILPADAANTAVTWSVVNGTGAATISEAGLVTGTAVGTITVKATAKDGSGIVGTMNMYIYNPSNNNIPVVVPPVSTGTPTATPTVTDQGTAVVTIELTQKDIDTGKKEVTIPVTEEVLKQIENSETDRITLDLQMTGEAKEVLQNNSIILQKELLEALKKAQKSVEISVQGENQLSYRWTFEKEAFAASNQDMTDVNLSLEVIPAVESELNKALDADTLSKSVILEFGHEGVLPAQATVKVYVGDQKGITPGSKIYLYHYNHETGKLETLPYSSDYTVDKDGFITINIVHCSDYVALTKEPSVNLITSLRKQINVTPTKKILYTDGTGKTTRLKVILPATLEIVASLDQVTEGSAIGGVTVSYSSSNKKIAKVDKNGKITAVSDGKATITTTIKLYSGKIKTVKTVITVK